MPQALTTFPQGPSARTRAIVVPRLAPKPALRARASLRYSVDKSDPKSVALGLVDRGDQKATQGELMTALRMYDRALSLWPDNDVAQNNRACALFELGNHEDALRAVELALEINSTEPAVHLTKSFILESVGRYEEALASTRRALALKEDSAEAHCALADCLSALGQHEDALVSYDHSRNLGYDLPAICFRRAECLSNIERFDDAIKEYQLGISLGRTDAIAYCNLGVLLLDADRFDEAIEAFSKAIEVTKTISAAYFNRALAYVSMGHDDRAIEDYERAIEVDSGQLKYYWSLSSSLKSLDRTLEGLAVLEEATAISPLNSITNYYRGLLLSDLGRWQEAITCYDTALSNNVEEALRDAYPTGVEVIEEVRRIHRLRGLALNEVGQTEETLVALELAIGLGDSHLEVYVVRAICLARLGRMQEAYSAMNDLRLREAESSAVHFAIGVVLAAGGELDAALDSLERVHDDDDPGAMVAVYQVKGNVLTQLRRFNEAIAAYDSGLELDPRNIGLILARVTALFAGDQVDAALSCCDQELAHNPRSAAVHWSRAYALKLLGRADEAVLALNEAADLFLSDHYLDNALGCLDQALGIDPNNTRSLMRRVFALTELGDLEEALIACNSALQISQGDFRLHLFRSNILQQMCRPTEALQDVEMARQLGGSSLDILYYRYPILLDMNRGEEALRETEELTRANPKDPDIEFHRGLILAKLEHHADALAAFDHAIALGLVHDPVNFFRGLSMLALNRLEEALLAFDVALARTPNDATYHYHRGRVLVRLSRYSEALEEFDRSDQEAEETYLARGQALAALGRHEEACSWFTRLLEINPKSDDARKGRVAALLATEAYEQARLDIILLMNNTTLEEDIENLEYLPYKRDVTKEKLIDDFARTIGIPDGNREIFRRTVSELLLLPLPSDVPEEFKWENRSESADLKDLNPPDFLRRIWGIYIDSGQLFQFKLGKLDPGLLQALKNHCRAHKIAVASILPPKSEFTDRSASAVAARPDLQRSVAAVQRRKERMARAPKPK